MRIERSKNAARNITFGTILKLYQIAVPFALRTIMMYAIGVKYLGLNSLFTSVMQVLNLAELGVGSAMVFSMYKPISDDDTVTICALMRLYKIYYSVIGAVILGGGILIIPFIPRLISGDVPPDINVYVLYLLNLLATVFTYWLFAYKNSILQAHQRTDVVSKVTLVTDTCKYIIQIVVLVVLHNYYYYIIALLATQIINNILTAVEAQKLFPHYVAKGKLPKETVKAINCKIKDLFTSKVGYTIVSSADTIVISAFLGLTLLAQYQNYYFIMNAVMGFVSIINTSITAGVGNSMLTKSKEQNYKEFEIFTLLMTWFCGMCICCLCVLYQPFMRIWMGENMLLDGKMVILFCVYFWVYQLVMMISVYKDAGGIWHEDRFRPLAAGLANLMLNLIMVRIIGLYGVVLSTIISICLISLPWIIRNVFAMIFKDDYKKYAIKLIQYSCVILVAALMVYFITSLIPDNGWFTLFAKAFVCVLLSSSLFVLLLHKDCNYADAKVLIFKMFKIESFLRKFKK